MTSCLELLAKTIYTNLNAPTQQKPLHFNVRLYPVNLHHSGDQPFVMSQGFPQLVTESCTSFFFLDN